MHRLVITLCCSLPLFAQQPTEPKPSAPATAAKLTAQSFLPDDYRNIAFADLKALRDRGIWDELQVSVLKVAFVGMTKELGCPLDDLDRATLVATVVESEQALRPANLSVLEGNKALPLPPSVVAVRVGGGGWDTEQLGNYEVRRRGDKLVVQPSAELLVTGPAIWVEATLSGKSKGGVPSADLMSLLSGRADALAYMVLDLDTPIMGDAIKERVLPGIEWPAGDAPQFVSARLLATGSVDDPHLVAEVVLRHRQPGAGQQASVRGLEGVLQRWREDPTKQALRAALKQAQVTTDRTDVMLRGDLGRARDAVGTLATLLLPLFAPSTESVRVERAAAPPPPAPPEKK